MCLQEVKVLVQLAAVVAGLARLGLGVAAAEGLLKLVVVMEGCADVATRRTVKLETLQSDKEHML
jgi:hypothetical protein